MHRVYPRHQRQLMAESPNQATACSLWPEQVSQFQRCNSTPGNRLYIQDVHGMLHFRLEIHISNTQHLQRGMRSDLTFYGALIYHQPNLLEIFPSFVLPMFEQINANLGVDLICLFISLMALIITHFMFRLYMTKYIQFVLCDKYKMYTCMPIHAGRQKQRD